MPFKDPEMKRRYDRERYQRLRGELVEALGGRCVVEGCERSEDLEIHHIQPYNKRSRPNSIAYFNPKGKELRCEEDHSHTETWRRGRKRRANGE